MDESQIVDVWTLFKEYMDKKIQMLLSSDL